MRTVLVLLVICVLTIGSLGCGSRTRPPATEDTAVNPPPEIVNIPPPDDQPAPAEE